MRKGKGKDGGAQKPIEKTQDESPTLQTQAGNHKFLAMLESRCSASPMKHYIWLAVFILIAPILARAADAPSKSAELQSAADIVVQVDTADQWTILKPLPRGGGKPPVLNQRGFTDVLRHIQRNSNMVMVVFTTQLQAQEVPDKSIARLHPFFNYLRFQRIVYAQATGAQATGNFRILRDTTEDRIQFKSLVSESENQWVVYSPQGFSKDDKLHTHGYIYIDAEVGFTFHMTGMFRITDDGRLQPEENKELASVMLKARIDTDMLVAQLTPEDRKQLNLPDEPDWLHYYKTDPGTVHYKTRWGWAYNHIGACEKALVFLEAGYKQAPGDTKLLFELTYAYNALGRFKDAAKVLEKALQNLPKDFFLNREYAYALFHGGDAPAAIKQYLKTVELCPPDNMSQKAEAAFNLAQCYQASNDPQNARTWFGNAKKWAPADSAVGSFFKNNPNFGSQ